MSRVYVIIVNWNGWRDTIECLESVFRLRYPDYRVIVCDNGSRDQSIERISEWARGELAVEVTGPLRRQTDPPVSKPVPFQTYARSKAEQGGDPDVDSPLIVVDCDDNLGFAGANNVGLRYALACGGSHAWLLNNDTVVEPDALDFLVERLREKPEAGMCGSLVKFYREPQKIQAVGGGYHFRWVGLPWHYGRFFPPRRPLDPLRAERKMNYVEGCSLLVTREFLQEVGLMSEDYFLYFEETDWALRGAGRFSLACAPGSVVYHKVGAAIGTSSRPWEKSRTCDYYSIRNRILFTRRFFPYALPGVYFFLVLTLLSKLLLRQWDRARMTLVLILSGGRSGELA